MSLVTSHKSFIKSHNLSMFRHSSLSILKIFATAKHLTVWPLCIPSYLCLTPSDPVTSLWCHTDFGKSSTAVWTFTAIIIQPQSTAIFYLEAVFELLGDKVEDYGIDAGVDGCHVDAEVVEHQQETATTEEEHTASKSAAKKDEEMEALKVQWVTR